MTAGNKGRAQARVFPINTRLFLLFLFVQFQVIERALWDS